MLKGLSKLCAIFPPSLLELVYGEETKQHISLKIVLISYVISILGSYTTLELLRHRTSTHGIFNCSSLSMGGIAIWSMHFLGNRAIILHDGDPQYQLEYNPGFTALSFFLPILVLLLAYLLTGTNEKVSPLRVFSGGIFGGLAICGMHYTGQAGISNYIAFYNIGYVIGSVIIAIFATVFTLALFFTLQSKWENAWWKLLGCSVLLASAVSGMHWVASLGTAYRYRRISNKGISQKTTIIFIGVISAAACFLLLAFAFVTTRQLKARKDRAEKVVLTRAIFDNEGKLLVTIDGMLISHEITDTYHERSLNDEFDVDHHIFYWIYKVSRSWKSVMNLVPIMKEHVKLSYPCNNEQIDYSLIFKERFIVTATRLAELLHEPLSQVGILYDGIMKTGQKKRRRSKRDEEMLNQISRISECNRYLSYGFRFAPVHLILDGLVRSLQVPREEITEYIDSMKLYRIYEESYKPDKFNDSMIPCKMLSLRMLDQEQMSFLKSSENITVKQILHFLSQNNHPQTFDSSLTLFKAELKEALSQINQYVNEYLFQDAILIPELTHIPCSGHYQGKHATMILFRHVIPIHIHLQPNNNVKFIPLSLFKANQWSILGQGEELFTQDIQREFSPIFKNLERIRTSQSSYPVITTIQKSEESFNPAFNGITVSKSISVSVENQFNADSHKNITNQTAVETTRCDVSWVDEVLSGIVWNH
ncbi:hypothetical protein MERGE_002315 [Pneumocystis wakefieldiae]|uniref:MHYT domain-containing protein n=1 Tax=Pneumocystis wakefieldiae TaxID=38082 RepID=A0A899FTB4_9ASCO|nr:hypothetical protein MERGE_002315 [Pneumocystis wakefieldiae]